MKPLRNIGIDWRSPKRKERLGSFRAGPSLPELFDSLGEWVDAMGPLLGKLCYFGQEVSPPPRPIRTRHRGEALTLEEKQRVFLSWLSGDSASQKAKRAGVSRRSLYAIIRKLIYTRTPRWFLKQWQVIGLVTTIVVPRCREDPSAVWPKIVCLVCHWVICPYSWDPPNPVTGKIVRIDPDSQQLAYANWQQEACAVQAHLILHFWLAGDPLYMWSETSWSLISDKTHGYVSEYEAVRDWVTDPDDAGADSDPEQWERWRRRILEGHKTNPPPSTSRDPGMIPVRFHPTPNWPLNGF